MNNTTTAQTFAAEARALTDRIKIAVEGAWHLIEQAYTTRAWAALGYRSWDDYCQREFGTSRLRLPREERQEVVASLREIGMSTRAIASATGISEATVRRDLPGASNDAPEPAVAYQVGTPRGAQAHHMPPRAKPERVEIDPTSNTMQNAPAAARGPEEAVNRHAPAATVTGTDGKAYAAAVPKPTAPRPVKKQTNIRAVVADALTDIARARNTLTALTREQITSQDEEARRIWAANLSESIEALTGFTNQLTKES